MFKSAHVGWDLGWFHNWLLRCQSRSWFVMSIIFETISWWW